MHELSGIRVRERLEAVFEHAETSRIPLPPEIVQVIDEEDRRTGFFQHVVVNITWRRPESENSIACSCPSILNMNPGSIIINCI